MNVGCYRTIAIAYVSAISAAAGGFAREPATVPAREIPAAQLCVTTRLVPLGIETNRMRGVNFDAHGNAWIALVETDRRTVLKANPITGKTEVVLVTTAPSSDKLYMDNVVPVGRELFVCGGWYPRQIIFGAETRTSRESGLRKPGPEVFNAIVVNGTVYSFDGNNGIIRLEAG